MTSPFDSTIIAVKKQTGDEWKEETLEATKFVEHRHIHNRTHIG